MPSCRFPLLRIAMFHAAKFILALTVFLALAVILGTDWGQVWL